MSRFNLLQAHQDFEGTLVRRQVDCFAGPGATPFWADLEFSWACWLTGSFSTTGGRIK